MKLMLLVAAGGALGSVARYTVSSWLLRHALDWRFPVGTFSVNVIGCLAAGLLAALAERQHWLTPDVRLLIFTGILGGFTTFSAFGLETMLLVKRGDYLVAALNVVLSVAAGLLALWLGLAAGYRWRD